MSAPDVAPGFGQIPLPAGMSLEEYLTLQGQIVTIAITAAVATGILLWDYCVLLGDEMELYRGGGKDLWRTPGTWFFVVLRYAGIVAMVPSLFFTSVQSSHCQVAVSLSQVGAVMAVGASGAIFCVRVFALWNGNNIVRGVVGTMYCAMLACWIAVGSQNRASQGPPSYIGSNCQMHPMVTWAPISFGSSVAFDTTVLILTLAQMQGSLSPTSSNLTRQIYQDNLVYFVITTAANIVVLTIDSLGPAHDLLKPAVLPLSTLMTVTMGSRVYLNLKLMRKQTHRTRESTTQSTSRSYVFSSIWNSKPLPTVPPSVMLDDISSFGPRLADEHSFFAKPKSSHSIHREHP